MKHERDSIRNVESQREAEQAAKLWRLLAKWHQEATGWQRGQDAEACSEPGGARGEEQERDKAA